MDYEQLISDFKESESTSSPIWIWFSKDEKDAKCTLCNSSIPRKDSTTTGMVNHLKRHHGFLSKNNAWKTYEELSSLKENRLKNKRKIDLPDEQKKKQPKLSHCLPVKYGPSDPRQVKNTNAMASMICRDGVPTNIANRSGFRNAIETLDPRYTLPNATTFARSIIPKLKENVDSFQQKKIENMLKNELSMAFTTDGLDCQDTDKSAVYSFSIHYYEKNELRSEVLFVKRLEAPVTGEVIKDFINKCLTDIQVIDSDGRPKLAIWGVTDAGSNIVRALKLLKAEGTIAGYHHCFNHNLQNVIKDAIKTTPGMEKTLKAFRENAAILSRSKNERTAFRRICQTNDVPAIIPPVPNDTRWFAMLAMMVAFLKVEKGVKLYAATSNSLKPLSPCDWKNAQGYVDILKPFHTATKIEEAENYLTLSSIIPILTILHQKTSGLPLILRKICIII